MSLKGLELLSIEILASERHKSHLLQAYKVEGELSNSLNKHPELLASPLKQGLHGGVGEGVRVVAKQAVDVLLHPLHHKLVQGILHSSIHHLDRNTMVRLGKHPLSKRMNFRKTILRISRQKCVISRQKCVCSLWRDCYILYDHISHEMHVVQQFNMEIG